MKVENGTSSILYTFNEFELNQYDTEIKEPLLKEIEKLKTENYHLKQELEFGKSSYANLQEQLKLANKANKDVQELVLEHRRKAKQEVINELLEWAEANEDKCYASGLKEINSDDLKQKLNQMKGD